jgi:beta-lactamase class D
MLHTRHVAIFLSFFFYVLPCYALNSIDQVFKNHQLQGTLVLHALKQNTTVTYNPARAQQAFASASTFKILHTLIALQENVIHKDDIIAWDGTIYDIKTWNQDQSLKSAFNVSCVWCYQEFAKKISPQTYQFYIANTKFGHLITPFPQTTFWLDGSLSISALEQIDFLKALYHHQFKFNEAHYQTLADIMLVEQTDNYRLYAKTGWAVRGMPKIGWYVGYVETAQDTWFFAFNADINEAEDLALRQLITKTVLQQEHIIHD